MAAAGDMIAEFDASRGSVRDLVESGVASVPPLFLLPTSNTPPTTDFPVPTIDLSLPRSAVVQLVGAAARTCGIFHITNHGVDAGAAVSVVRAFHELPAAARSAFYAVTSVDGISYSTVQIVPGNETPGTGAGPLLPWRDTMRLFLQGPTALDLGRLPPACRDALREYLRCTAALGKKMAGLLSEALGVGPDALEAAMEVEGWVVSAHYYPPCPEPELVEGAMVHTDPSAFTVLAQDDIGGLQVRLDDGSMAEVPPVPGALLVIIGDVLKMVSNDEFNSPEHGVRIKSTQDARVSVGLFFNPGKHGDSRMLGPLAELVITAEAPARYRSFTMAEFAESRRQVGGNARSSIQRFRVLHG